MPAIAARESRACQQNQRRRCSVAKKPAPTTLQLETFPNPAPQRDYAIRHVAPEFTSLCPKTGQPDFGTVTLEYVPDKVCVELKSLKLYLQGFRNEGIFYEDVTNRILDELTTLLKPRWMQITTEWTPRGGMHSVITAEYAPRGR